MRITEKYEENLLTMNITDCQYFILMFMIFINQKEKIGLHSLIQVQEKQYMIILNIY